MRASGYIHSYMRIIDQIKGGSGDFPGLSLKPGLIPAHLCDRNFPELHWEFGLSSEKSAMLMGQLLTYGQWGPKTMIAQQFTDDLPSPLKTSCHP